MSKETKKKKNNDGLWVPNVILNLFDIDEGCKLLLAHFYSFGEKGCYQSNKTLAEIFMTHRSTIKRRITKLRKYLHIKNPKGYYRTVWVRFHPEVESLAKSGQKTPCQQGSKENHNQAQKCTTSRLKNVPPSGSKAELSLAQNCAPTNTYTNTETNKGTAADLPMPAGGQASRLLEQRRAAARQKIEQFKKKFSIGRNKPADRMLPEEFERRKQMIIKQLRGS